VVWSAGIVLSPQLGQTTFGSDTVSQPLEKVSPHVGQQYVRCGPSKVGAIEPEATTAGKIVP